MEKRGTVTGFPSQRATGQLSYVKAVLFSPDGHQHAVDEGSALNAPHSTLEGRSAGDAFSYSADTGV
jgi:hypothetical protein